MRPIQMWVGRTRLFTTNKCSFRPHSKTHTGFYLSSCDQKWEKAQHHFCNWLCNFTCCKLISQTCQQHRNTEEFSLSLSSFTSCLARLPILAGVVSHWWLNSWFRFHVSHSTHFLEPTCYSTQNLFKYFQVSLKQWAFDDAWSHWGGIWPAFAADNLLYVAFTDVFALVLLNAWATLLSSIPLWFGWSHGMSAVYCAKRWHARDKQTKRGSRTPEEMGFVHLQLLLFHTRW